MSMSNQHTTTSRPPVKPASTWLEKFPEICCVNCGEPTYYDKKEGDEGDPGALRHLPLPTPICIARDLPVNGSIFCDPFNDGSLIVMRPGMEGGVE